MLDSQAPAINGVLPPNGDITVFSIAPDTGRLSLVLNQQIKDPITNEERKPDERFLRAVEEKIHISDSGKQSFRQEVVRKAMGAFKRGEKFTLDSHAQLHNAVQQYLFEQRREVLRLVSSSARPDEDVRKKISVVEKRLVDEYGYDSHSAREALNYVTTLMAQE